FSYKSSLSGCDTFNYSITNVIITVKTRQVLPCDHVYHNKYFSQDRFKCLHCLDYVKDDVDKHVQLLLVAYVYLNQKNNVENEKLDVISEEDNDTKESADSILAP
ncbi:10455_t:CDS:1, partial [Funneliformis caledonium]